MSEIYKMAGHMIRRLHQMSVAIFAEHVSDTGFDLTSVQFAALSEIDATPGIDQATLAEAIAFDRATIGGVIDRLERKGWVKRTVKEEDRRARSLRLTKEGKSVLEEITPVVRSLQNDILADLTKAERAEFLKMLAKLTKPGSGRSSTDLVSEKA